MKRITAILLVSGLLMQIFSKQLALAEYSLNRDFIAKVLCVNKDVPDNTCLGKCHLKKELSKDDENSPVNESKTKFSQENFWISGTKFKIEFYSICLKSNGCELIPTSLTSWNGDIFHPPGC